MNVPFQTKLPGGRDFMHHYSVLFKDVKYEMGSLGELMTIQCDVAKEDEVKSMFALIDSKYGGVEICINNAGLSKDCPILSGSSEDWQTVMDVSE